MCVCVSADVERRVKATGANWISALWGEPHREEERREERSKMSGAVPHTATQSQYRVGTQGAHSTVEWKCSGSCREERDAMLNGADRTAQAASQPKYAIGLYCSKDSVLYNIKEVQLHINYRSKLHSIL